MGLTNWKNSPDGPIYKYDVDIAKNYLSEKELKDLNRIVTTVSYTHLTNSFKGKIRTKKNCNE